MKLLVTYYIIGVLVSFFNIWYYRYSKHKKQPKQSDSLLAIIGVWLFPLQIILFIYQKLK